MEPVLRGCDDGVWPYTLVARVASEAPSAVSVPASSRSSCGRSIVRPVSLPPYCIMLLILSAHGTAGCRSRPVEEDREAMGKRFSLCSTRSVCAFRIPPSWVGLVMHENAHTWLKHFRPLTLTLRSCSPARAGGRWSHYTSWNVDLSLQTFINLRCSRVTSLDVIYLPPETPVCMYVIF
ncbi:hypothetical protein EDB83DRAFT_1729321 [Lactarius deliciosus]|nr:hypothetical protein EDB83DRAFT_1729321 [Lactarius deliciosus]